MDRHAGLAILNGVGPRRRLSGQKTPVHADTEMAQFPLRSVLRAANGWSTLAHD
jgi:hypothetical protein